MGNENKIKSKPAKMAFISKSIPSEWDPEVGGI